MTAGRAARQRAGVQRCRSGTAEPGLRLAAGLHRFCNMRGHGGEVLEALNVLLERPEAQPPTRARARALTVGCHLLDYFGTDPTPPAMVSEALKIARSLADDAIAADAHWPLADLFQRVISGRKR